MNNLLDQPLSKIVLDNFQTARIFENNGLDFCCRGKQTLRTACIEKGIGVDAILSELTDTLHHDDREPDFKTLSLSALTTYIVEIHHSYIRMHLPIISNYLFKIATKHGDKFPYMKRVFILFTQVRTELETHLPKEEQIVFPLISDLDNFDADFNAKLLEEPLDILENEHEIAGTLMQTIRGLTNNYESPQGACTTFQLAMNGLKAFEADLHKHVHLENNILFPKAVARLESLKAEVL